MSTKTHLALLLTGMAWAGGSAIGPEMSADQQALLKALPEAKITLQQGLAASASQRTAPFSEVREEPLGTVGWTLF